MSDFTVKFLQKHKQWLERTKEYLGSATWHEKKIDQVSKTSKDGKEKPLLSGAKSLTDLKEKMLKNDLTLAANVTSRLKYFIKKTEGDKHLPSNKKTRAYLLEIIEVFLFHCNDYLSNNNLQDIKSQSIRNLEIRFQDLLFNSKIKIEDSLDEVGAYDDHEEVEIQFYKKDKASLIMREPLVLTNQDINLKVDNLGVDWDINNSKEMLLNMNPNDIPPYNHRKHFFDQDTSTIEFWQAEYQKMIKGVNINGYHVHPWLYHHLNIFQTKIPVSKDVEKIMNPPLRDNEWFFAENLKTAETAGNRGLMMYGTRRFSKALRDDQILMYIDGTQRPIGEAKIGDKIFGSDGKETTIQCVSPQGFVDIYEVELQDGRKSYCCEDHLWSVFDYQSKVNKVLPLKELLANGGYSYTRKRSNKAKDSVLYKYFIPIARTVDYIGEILPLDPYYLGLWLGNGTLANPDITTEDQETKDYLRQFCTVHNLDYKETAKKNKTARVKLVRKKGTTKENIIKEKLKALKVLNNKHIPSVYLTAKKEDRLALLQGLMDTDGTISKGGAISFCSGVKKLADQVVFLCRSLGIHCYVTPLEGSHIKKNGEFNTYFNVIIFTDKPIFRLKRKLKRIDAKPNTSRKSKMGRVAIINITKVENSKATCIRVDNLSKEFLTNDFIVTHNSTIMASYIEWKAKTKFNSVATLTGGSESDLLQLLDKLDTSLMYSPEALKLVMQKRDGDRTNGIMHMGLKPSASELLDFSQIMVQNLAAGRKTASQKTAGGAPSAFVVDEIGKFAFLGAYLAALPSFATPHGFKCVPILSGTGGEADLSQDAMKVLANPEAYNMIPMDWDMLESKIDPEHITWKRKMFATFMPGQMGYEVGFKYIKKPFGDFLGIKNAKDLNKIEINQADWQNNNKILDNIIAEAEKEKGTKGKVLVQQKKVQNPRDPEDCFITIEGNPFPSEEAKVHKNKIIETGDTGRKVFLIRDSQGNIVDESAEDFLLAEFPHAGGFVDAPVQLFEPLPTRRPEFGLYVAGMDDYKHDESNGESIGSLYIYKRQWFDPFSLTIVASYAARPNPRSKFDRQVHYLLKAYNAVLFHENEDNNFKTYLDGKHETEMYMAQGFDFAAELNLNNNGNRKYGWQATTKNIEFGYSLIKKYLEKEFEVIREDGTKFTILGVQRIKDVGLLEEVQNFTKEGNFDRLRGFMGALMYSHYLDSTYQFPSPKSTSKENNQKEKNKNYNRVSPFRKQSGGFFRK